MILIFINGQCLCDISIIHIEKIKMYIVLLEYGYMSTLNNINVDIARLQVLILEDT